MSGQTRVIEALTTVAPLGMRFLDTATQTFVGSGLNVTARPLHQPRRTVQALVNTSAVYLFPHLPGLRELENGKGDEQYWTTLPPGRPFTVEVTDREGRFLPCRFAVLAPARGLFALACGWPVGGWLGSPLLDLPAVPLFSSPGRVTPAGMAAIRGQLQAVGTQGPAAWALARVQTPNAPGAVGMADAEGQLVIFLPYPEPPGQGVGSPAGVPPAPLWAQHWFLPVSVYYQPALGSPVTPPAADESAPPDLCDLLQQGQSPLWLVQSPPLPLAEVELRYGEEAVLRSQSASGEKLPVVFVGN